MTLLEALRNLRFGVVVVALTCTGCLILGRLTNAVLHDEDEVEPQQQSETKYITQDTEDALKQATLHKLLDHYNFAIRDSASKIVYDRGLNDRDTVQELVRGITQPGYDERLKSLRALANITDATSLPLLNKRGTYRAFVKSLQYSLTDAPLIVLNDRHWDEYPLRDMAEKFCLVFLKQLVVTYGAKKLIKAGFVEKWLGAQLWGETLEERNLNFCAYQFKCNKIVDLCQAIVQCEKGKKALQEVKLLPTDEEVEERQRKGRPGLTLIERTHGLMPRNREQSAEEVRLRHRHREAMVLNDGTTPLGRADIFERMDDIGSR